VNAVLLFRAGFQLLIQKCKKWQADWVRLVLNLWLTEVWALVLGKTYSPLYKAGCMGSAVAFGEGLLGLWERDSEDT
jgi:hypothetical protein